MTRAHRKADGQIIGSRGYKYKKIIKQLFNSEKVGGGGGNEGGRGVLKKFGNAVDYVYFDDVNDLVERLKLLIASQAAGHNGHDNEIISIIEELKERLK